MKIRSICGWRRGLSGFVGVRRGSSEFVGVGRGWSGFVQLEAFQQFAHKEKSLCNDVFSPPSPSFTEMLCFAVSNLRALIHALTEHLETFQLGQAMPFSVSSSSSSSSSVDFRALAHAVAPRLFVAQCIG